MGKRVNIDLTVHWYMFLLQDNSAFLQQFECFLCYCVHVGESLPRSVSFVPAVYHIFHSSSSSSGLVLSPSFSTPHTRIYAPKKKPFPTHFGAGWIRNSHTKTRRRRRQGVREEGDRRRTAGDFAFMGEAGGRASSFYFGGGCAE